MAKFAVEADDSRPGVDPEIARLAALAPLAYDRCRTAEAEKLGVRVSTLDAEVDRARTPAADAEGQGGTLDLPDVDPWPHPVEGARLLEDLAATFRRHAALPMHAEVVLAIWIVMTYLFDAITVAPVLAITSPEKGCGKTTLLEIISRLARRVLSVSNISSAALFRSIEKWAPTLLIDEADSFATTNDELRGVLNSGHTRQTAFVVRCVGEDSEPRIFSTWGCKALAAIGKLPDTVMDRSIEIRLRRALPGEVVEKIRHASPLQFERLSRQAARWAADNADAIRCARPAIPDSLSNRSGDNAEPLLAIADLAGDECGESVRRALMELVGMRADDTPVGVALLRDVLAAFDRHCADRLPTKTILDELTGDEVAPWLTFDHGRPITARQLSRRLGAFGVKRKTFRDGVETHKGYMRDDVADQAARYVPLNGTPVTGNKGNSVTRGAENGLRTGDVTDVTDVAEFRKASEMDGYARASRGE